jgi:hypothetical protein
MDRSIRSSHRSSRWLLALGLGAASAMSIALAQAQEMCGGQTYPFPFTDVSGVGAAFCPGIVEAYVTGVSKGTTPTTFSPNDNVPRLQMTTFLQRSLDQGLTRASRRAALNQWGSPRIPSWMQQINTSFEHSCAADGTNIWATTGNLSTVVQVQANTGQVLGTWTGAPSAEGVLVAAGLVFVAGQTSPGSLYVVFPTSPGPAIVGASNLGNNPTGIAFDGIFLWTANAGPPGSISAIGAGNIPFPVTTITLGFNSPYGILYDGAYIWVTDSGAGTLLKLDVFGAIVQTVAVGLNPRYPVFDGINIWVPNFGSNSITVVQASSGHVVATINTDTKNKLSGPLAASFDGERVLVTNNGGASVTVFKAADLSLIANVETGPSTAPGGACSDGINFWVTLTNGFMLRF